MSLVTMPKAPNSGDPDGFAGDMDAWAPAFNQAAQQFNALALAFGPGSPFCSVVSGTNTLVLSSGLNLPALTVGLLIRFRANVVNPGNPNINLDGLGVKACRTPNGQVPPAGYIRADVDTVAVYDGTYWVTSRAMESLENANGRWWRYEDGRQDCISVGIAATPGTANGPLYRSAAQAWTFPVSFAFSPMVSPGQVSVPADTWVSCQALSATQAEAYVHCTSSQPSRSFRLSASGRWF